MAKPKGKLLICVSDLKQAENALHYACNKAKKQGLVVEFISVIDTLNKEYQGFFSIGDKFQQEQRAEAERQLSALAEKAYKKYKIRPVINIKEGIAPKAICETLRSDQTVKMIILSASPNSMSNGKFIPYLTEQITEEIHVPIFIIPTTLTLTQVEELT